MRNFIRWLTISTVCIVIGMSIEEMFHKGGIGAATGSAIFFADWWR